MGSIQSKKSCRLAEEGGCRQLCSAGDAFLRQDPTWSRDNQAVYGELEDGEERFVAEQSGRGAGRSEVDPEEGELQLEDGTASDLARTLTEIEIPFDPQQSEAPEKDDGDCGGGAEDGEGGARSLSASSSDDNTQASTKLKVYSSQDIHFDGIIGEGEFGRVSKAILQGKSTLQVAVKVFHAHFDCVNTMGQLKTITQLKHRNVVAILGILESSKSSETASKYGPRVLLQYFPEGNLLHYLSRRCTERELANNPATLVKLLLDVAQGCEYLHSHGLVHGNLAARNVLVEKQFGKSMTHYNAKVSDYGIIQLATAKGVGKNYIRADSGLVVPIRHVPAELLAPESKGFSFQSDVWSFGVVVWEVLTKGAMPYGKRKEEAMVMRLIKSGMSPYDIRVPEGCSQELIDIMKQSFQRKPEERPTFTELTKSLSSHLSNCMTTPLAETQEAPTESQTSEETAAVSEQDECSSVPEDSKDERPSRPPPIRRRSSRSGLVRSRRPPARRNEASMGASASLSNESTARMPSSSDSRRRPPRVSGYGSSKSSRRGPPLPPRFARQSSTNPTFQAGGQSDSGQMGVTLAPPPLMSVAPPPPPYTANPLPNHSAVRGSLQAPSSSSGSSSRGSTRPSRPPRPVNYDRAIQRKTQELEQLKVRKLQQEASNTWSKMQSLVSQLTKLHTSPGSSSSGPSRGSVSSNDYQYRRASGGGGARGEYETGSHSRSVGGGRSRGRGSSAKLPPRFAAQNAPEYKM